MFYAMSGIQPSPGNDAGRYFERSNAAPGKGMRRHSWNNWSTAAPEVTKTNVGGKALLHLPWNMSHLCHWNPASAISDLYSYTLLQRCRCNSMWTCRDVLGAVCQNKVLGSDTRNCEPWPRGRRGNFATLIWIEQQVFAYTCPVPSVEFCISCYFFTSNKTWQVSQGHRSQADIEVTQSLEVGLPGQEPSTKNCRQSSLPPVSSIWMCPPSVVACTQVKATGKRRP